MPLSALDPIPDGVHHADPLIAAVDRCLVAGFARLGADHRDSLASVGRVFAGTPLGARVSEATAALATSAPSEPHLVALAAARESLTGACHDALVGQALSAVDGACAIEPDLALTPRRADGAVKTRMAGARQWLLELALAGFGQLEAQTVVPFAATLEALQAEPELVRLSALLTGLSDELMESVPTAGMSEVPARRWADLWSRAMVLAWELTPDPARTAVTGTLRVLGADVRHHDHVISLAAYGLLDVSGEPTRLVRTTVSAWKVDAAWGDEMWTAFGDDAAPLLTALADRKSLTISNMELLATGDLVWGDGAAPGKAFDPIAAALDALTPGAGLVIPTAAPVDRHPVQVAVPVALADIQITGKAEPCVTVDGATVPLAVDRTSRLIGLDRAALTRAASLVGLLRFDGGRWAVQPLVAGLRGKNQIVGPGDSIARSRKIPASKRTLATLQERAGKLLRK